VPYRSVTHGHVTLLCFPPYDEAFTRFAMHALAAMDTPDPEVLRTDLRGPFPRATVSPREPLASLHPGATWYVYRDGRYSPFDGGDPWWEDPNVAWINVDEEGRYTDANEAALELLGVDHATMLTLTTGDLADPSVSGLVPWVWALARETGVLHSTSILRERDGRPPVGIEYRLIRSPDGTWTSTLRAIPVEDAAASDDAGPTDRVAVGMGS
jgi:PAS domain-containing protein